MGSISPLDVPHGVTDRMGFTHLYMWYKVICILTVIQKMRRNHILLCSSKGLFLLLKIYQINGLPKNSSHFFPEISNINSAGRVHRVHDKSSSGIVLSGSIFSVNSSITKLVFDKTVLVDIASFFDETQGIALNQINHTQIYSLSP